MSESQQTPIWTTVALLTYSGAIPFIVLCLVVSLGWAPDLPVSPATVLVVYAAVIASFLAGIHWHVALMYPDSEAAFLGWSNAIAIAAWALACLPPSALSYVLFSILFVLLLLLDRGLEHRGHLHSRFYAIRIRITVVVSSVLLLPAFSSALG